MDLHAQGPADRFQLEPEAKPTTGRDAVQQGIGDELAHAEQHVVDPAVARPVDESLTHELSYERH